VKRLIFTADDFGMSLEVNEAVEAAHRDGVLTSASLVVAGDAAEDALRRMQRMPALSVGLHLALFGAPATVAGTELGAAPVREGIAMMLGSHARARARREIEAQIRGFAATGLPLTHLDGHWHCHQHPAVLAMAIAAAMPLGLKTVRLPYEPWRLVRAVHGGIAPAAALGALTHRPLAAAMRAQLRRHGLTANDWFFGKADAGAIDLPLLLRLIAALPPGVTEIGLHPALAGWAGRGPHAPPPGWNQPPEVAALTDPALRAALAAEGIALIGWSALA
jgi:hopanoid biosynthesis associated protein HpnK